VVPRPPRWSRSGLQNWSGQRLVIAVPYGWLLLFFLAPFLIVLKISFSEVQIAMPPYAPLLQWAQEAKRLVLTSTSATTSSCSPTTSTPAPSSTRPRSRRCLDAALPADRLPDGLRDRARAPAGATCC
jgi:hypothetical protein